MALLQTIKDNSEWIHHRVYHGDDWAYHFDEFMKLLNHGNVKLERIGQEYCIVLTDLVSESDNMQVEAMLSRYRPYCQEQIRAAIERWRMTRKGQRIAPSIVLRVLDSWLKYSTEVVEEGVARYLETNITKGFNEKYCTGIIRNINSMKPVHPATMQAITPRELEEAKGKAKPELDEVTKQKWISMEFRARGGLQLPVDQQRDLLEELAREFV